MKEQTRVTGIVLSVMPVGENDRRLTILTKERGKIQVFARGCRKPVHPLFAISQPLILGDFMIREGKTASYLSYAETKEMFPGMRADLSMICYGTYFAELAEYFTVEGMDETEVLNLLYVTIKAMERQQVPLPLIRRIYEYRMMVIHGIGPDLFHCIRCGKEEEFSSICPDHGGALCECCREKEGGDRVYIRLSPPVLSALRYVSAAPLGRLYSFRLTEEVQAEFSRLVRHFMGLHVDHRFRACAMLKKI